METQEFPKSGPEIKFYYGIHEPSNAAKFIDLAANSDIIFVEASGESVGFRINLDNYINITAGLPNSSLKSRALKEIAEDLLIDGQETFLGKVVDWAVKSGKEIHLIDSSDEGLGKKLKDQADAALVLAYNSFRKQRPSEAYRMFEKYTEGIFESTSERDSLVQKQILKWLEKAGGRWNNKRIIAQQGSAHRGTYRNFKKQNPEVKSLRIFGEDREGFELIDELITRKSTGKLSEDDIKRYFIFLFVLTFDNSERWSESIPIARSLSHEEIASTFDQLQKMEDFCERIPDTKFAQVYFNVHRRQLEEDIRQGRKI